MPFCEVFGLDRRRFWKYNLYWNYQCLLNVCEYVHESMFCYILQTSHPIKIVLVLFFDQSYVLWFFFPSKYWLAINLAFRLNVIYINHESKYTLLTCPKYTTIQNTNNNLAVWRRSLANKKRRGRGQISWRLQ